MQLIQIRNKIRRLAVKAGLLKQCNGPSNDLISLEPQHKSEKFGCIERMHSMIIQEPRLDLRKHVNMFKKFLKENDIDIKFFIAGGSVFSKTYNDVDLYFYSEEDFLEFKKAYKNSRSIYQTNNAYTFNIPTYCVDFQAIKKNFGPPEEIFQTFDFNCCKCAYTSEYEYIYDESYSKEIDINLSMFDFDTAERYFKYIDKGAIDAELKEFKKMVHFILSNPEREYESYYDNSIRSSKDVIVNLLNHAMKIEHKKIIHDIVQEYYEFNELLELFSASWFTIPDEYSCDALMINKLTNSKWRYAETNQNKKNEIIEKYPEYFIQE